ncbi:cytochrome c biogenesis heme-transporting ATPase CcmA [Piscinibacter sakaiensis]|uniref:ABC transporter, ATPase component CcmA n=1 Tax=Piscinibacter sakaiensis TaxID=1547922 RepID=A0A0K8P2D1_PISS1|nr:cytochrome c biogenesis heme-transporting ATPase CcmA [Piscinibacter sakaiensis]GAP36832.1 ABC transporter, ATPase component CcmA [Piscinibacter sakaiensis]
MSSAAAPIATAPLLAAEGLGCRRGERWLFQRLDLALRPGEVVWLRGANGRGKTSLLRLLAGLSVPAAGRVLHFGEPGRPAAAAAARQLYLAHANALKDDLGAGEALAFLATIHGRPATAAALEAALRAVGMASRRTAPVRSLSQGQRRRVALARLALDLAHPGDATVWLLDEPYDALDAEGCARLDGLLQAQAARGGAVLLTSHLPLALREPLPRELSLDALAPAAAPRRTAEAAAAAPVDGVPA